MPQTEQAVFPESDMGAVGNRRFPVAPESRDLKTDEIELSPTQSSITSSGKEKGVLPKIFDTMSQALSQVFYADRMKHFSLQYRKVFVPQQQ